MAYPSGTMNAFLRSRARLKGPLALGLVLLVLAVEAQTPAPIDREYTLESTMLGYRGVGGEIDGVRNPTLWARTGENVRINIVNGELMVHDVTLEKHNVRTAQILDKGATSNVTFKAKESDTYYCSVPGTPRCGNGGAVRGVGPAARAVTRHRALRERPGAQS